MRVAPYQFGLKDLLLLPLVGIAAIGVNSSLNYLLYDIERWWLHFVLDSVEGANWFSRFPDSISFVVERSVDLAAATLVALLLVYLGRRTHSAAFALLLTAPFAPRIGFDSFSFYFRGLQWLEGWPELAIAAIALTVTGALATRISDRTSSRIQQIALAGFFLLGLLGWWRLNPQNYGDGPLPIPADVPSLAVFEFPD